MKEKIKTWIEKNWMKILAALMLFYAIGDHPYSYYQLLRIVITGIAAYSAYLAHGTEDTFWKWIFIAIAIVFNPIAPIYSQKETWAIVDLITGLLFGVSSISTKSNKN